MQDNSLSKIEELDWDFHGDTSDSPFSDLHFHPGRFVPQIPAALIGMLTRVGETVLDPFCGAGTTLVEAQRLGRAAIGIDLNPISCLNARVKTVGASAREMKVELLRILSDVTEARLTLGSQSTPHVPAAVQLHKWYHPETGEQLVRIWARVSAYPQGLTRDLALFCFSASLITCCSETRSWGYICDNVRPLRHRYVDADATFRANVEALSDAYIKREGRILDASALSRAPVDVYEGDAAHQLAKIADESVDLVVTSPPYYGVVDYVKAQRLTFEWLGLPTEPLRKMEIGARSKRHRLTSHQEYVRDMEAVFRQLRRVLKAGGAAVFVVGESAKRPETLDEFARSLNEAGLTVRTSIQRTIGKRRRQPASLEIERVYVTERR